MWNISITWGEWIQKRDLQQTSKPACFRASRHLLVNLISGRPSPISISACVNEIFLSLKSNIKVQGNIKVQNMISYLDFLMFLVIGIKWISHAPFICSKILARLQHSVNLFVASILNIKKQSSLTNRNHKEAKWSSTKRAPSSQATEIRYRIWCMASSFNCIHSIKFIVRKWHFHKISLQYWDKDVRSITINHCPPELICPKLKIAEEITEIIEVQ